LVANNHIVSSFNEELGDISRMVTELGGIVEVALLESVSALVKQDHRLADRVIQTDRRADALFEEIEESAITLIATRQPVAQDLRIVIAAIRMANDLERVGDLAKNIAKRTRAIGDDMPSTNLLHGIQRLADLVAKQLNRVLDSFAQEDTSLAEEVWSRDDQVDAMYTSIFREMLTYMMENPRNISPCAHLLFCAKNIERIGDHATNLAETVYYKNEGKHLKGIRPKKDGSTEINISDI